MSHWVLSVTYKHSADNVLTVPEDKSDRFAKFINKLEAGEDVTIVSIGDSITEGWSSSKVKGNRAPFCPPYNEMFAQYVQSVYPDSQVTFKNLGKSGTTAGGGTISSGSPNGSNHDLLDQVCALNPDLVMVAYGMNDGCGTPPETYANNINHIVEYVNQNCTDVCMVIVGTSLPNPEFAWDGGGRCLVYHDKYPEALAAKEEDWVDADYRVGVADVTTMNLDLYQKKIYQIIATEKNYFLNLPKN
jgi:lysophospholipase L1-like esterase